MSLTILTNSESIITNALFFTMKFQCFYLTVFKKILTNPTAFWEKSMNFYGSMYSIPFYPITYFLMNPRITYIFPIKSVFQHTILYIRYRAIFMDYWIHFFTIISSLPSFGLGCLTEMTCQTAFFAKFTKARYQNRPKHEPENTKGNLSKSM